MRMSGARTRVVLWVLVFVACLTSVLPPLTANAAQITTRALTLEPNATALAASLPSSSAPSITGHADTTGLANHDFTFHVTTTAGINSIGFQYCTTAAGTCTVPTDLLSTGTNTSLGTTAGLGSSPTLNKTTNGAPYVSFTAPLSSTTIKVILNGVFNPSATNTTFFVRIGTYTTATPVIGTTTPTDAGVVAASTATPIIVSGQMPEYLVFCTAVSIALTGTGGTNVPNCTTATSGAVTFNQLFDPTTTATATSQMAAASNAGGGYQITYYGDNLKSGANVITAAGSSAAANNVGHSQFGLNIVHNTTLNVGTAVNTPTVTGNTYLGEGLAPYITDGSFAFVPNAATAVADSALGGTPGPSDLQEYTVSYIANVPGHQPAGTYSTTLTYVCTATY